MSEHQKPDTLTNLILRIAMIWRGLFAVVAAAGVITVWSGKLPEVPLWQKILLSLALSIAAGFSAFGAVEIARRNHRGRMISLVIDYLAFVVCAVMTLNIGEVFIGID